MPHTRVKGRRLLLVLFWALSLTALCLSMTGASSVVEGQGVAWTRTLPTTDLWMVATLALGLGYALLGRLYHAFGNVRFWLLAALFAAVATLGESFAQLGTAELVTSQPGLAFFYFVGRIPTYYMGMALLDDFLSHPIDARATADRATPDPPALALPGGRAVATGADPGWPGEPTYAERSPQEGMPYPEAIWNQTRSIPWENQNRGDYRGASPQAAPPSRVPPARGSAQPAYHATPWDTRAARPVPPQAATPMEPPARAQGMPTWAFALLLLICWLPYLWIVWPGTVSNDSIVQLAEAIGRKSLSNANPVFQTALVWLAVQVGQGWLGSADAAVSLYVIAQALLMAWLLGYTLRRMAEVRLPGWLMWLSVGFYALCPIFPLYAFCMGKDTMFAMAVLWLMMMVWRTAESRWPPFRTVFGLCLSAVLCALLRNAGVGLVAVTLVALLIHAVRRRGRQWRAPALAMVMTAVTMLVLYTAVLPALNAATAPETETRSIPLQQVARVVAGETLTEPEYAAINAVLPVDELAKAYNGELSDPVKDLWNSNATAEQKSVFFSFWGRMAFKYPATYLSAFFHNTYGYLLPGYVSTIKPTFLLGMEGRTTLIDGAFDFTVNPRAVAFKTTLQSLFGAAPFRLLVAPGLYGWLTLFAFAAVWRKGRRTGMLVLLPALLTLLGCLFSAVNGYFRYAMPLYLSAPVMLAVVAHMATAQRHTRETARQPVLPN